MIHDFQRALAVTHMAVADLAYRPVKRQSMIHKITDFS